VDGGSSDFSLFQGFRRSEIENAAVLLLDKQFKHIRGQSRDVLLGAISVLATVTPISALDAAIFTGRLMLRLADFVPLISGSGQRWSDVITGLLRMAYVTDTLRSFLNRGWLSEGKYLEIHYRANQTINLGKSDWFEEVLSSVSKAAGISPFDVQHFWKEHAYFTSTLQYVHLGSPEKITIVADAREKQEDSHPSVGQPA